MSSANEQSRPAVRVLVVLLGITALATVAVEVLNWWVAEEGGYSLAVRTTWASLRSLGFLMLIWQVRRGRASARPFALILCVTTLFALARLVVPRQGTPGLVGVAGFMVAASLCTGILLLLYRSAAVRDHLRRMRRRPAPPGWILTARVAALSYSPLMLVAAAVALGQIFAGRVAALPLVLGWFAAGIVVSYATMVVTFFLARQMAWAQTALLIVTATVLVVDLPLCWLLLGTDGLVRDGGPLLVSAALAVFAVSRAGAARQASVGEYVAAKRSG